MADDWAREFGEWIRRYRLERGYSQEELGKLADVSKQYISNLERAEPSTYTGKPTRPKIEIVDNLAKALHRPIQEARDLAGYGIKQDAESEKKPVTVEEALKNAFYFHAKGLSQKDEEMGRKREEDGQQVANKEKGPT